MLRPEAEALALDALDWLAGSDDLLGVFMGTTGLSVDDLRGRADSDEVMTAVLDFLVMDDAWIAAYCESRGRAYTEPMAARVALSGGEMHWT